MNLPTAHSPIDSHDERDHDDLEREVKAELKVLHEKLDRITLAIITGALAMSVSLIAVAVTIVAQGP